MRLKTNIFLWIFLATVLPLAFLTFVAITLTEREYLTQVSRDVNSSISNIVSEIDRRLYYERQMVLSLANSSAVRQYHPVLKRASEGDLHHEYFQRSDVLERFLAGFQGVVPGFKSIRVLDTRGNTLIKVRYGVGIVGMFDGIESFPYAEEEIDNPKFVAQLNQLPRNDLSFFILPESRWEEEEELRGPTILDAFYPLVNEDSETVGFLVASFNGELVDKILDVVPRLHDGDLLIAELNPDMPGRDGMVLYDDVQSLNFGMKHSAPAHLKTLGGGLLWDKVRSKPYGEFMDGEGQWRTYYLDYLPYPNQLASWILAIRINMDTLVAPFNRIRLAIVLVVALAALLSLLIATLGARTISRPVIELGRMLRSYARGDRASRIQLRGADEIRRMESSFNEMADTLFTAEQERDRAQHLMLQSAKLASIGEMAAGIGHEINNPLNNILSLIKLMRRGVPAENQKLLRDLDSLREETLRASTIVKAILNFARQVPPQYTRFDLREWLQETIALVQQTSRSRHVQVRLLECEAQELEGDRVQLQQVLVNLLLNAVQASQSGQHVEVSVKAGQETVQILVRDHGTGITDQDLDRIYDPFFSTKAVGEGSGLGLSISLGIVQRHDGELHIGNHPDGGVLASLTLPMRNQAGQGTTPEAPSTAADPVHHVR